MFSTVPPFKKKVLYCTCPTLFHKLQMVNMVLMQFIFGTLTMSIRYTTDGTPKSQIQRTNQFYQACTPKK
ncbi:hypothetical protein SORBI_3009G260550 [Sorghum bicolor]|uniref:Uncharacterized protein n=1 Tax=Sorghum bicolor TaxID=4558 RepID=A0A1Z5R481_SORBI|nr:hypothetical protein SORBI_3009G260550 [Sorghum bicolor]